MLKKKYRLTSGVKLRGGKLLSDEFFTMRFIKNGLRVSRFGFVVSKKIDKRAVGRNRLKRVLRSCVEEIMSEFETGWDVLFVVDRRLIGQDRSVVLQHTQNFLKSSGLLT